jgi:hypothetical protein
MNDFNHKVEEASARLNQAIAEATARFEKETAEIVTHINDSVVPTVRQHSVKALRTASEKVSQLADYMESKRKP